MKEDNKAPRKWKWVALPLFAVILAAGLKAWSDTSSTPIVRQANIPLAGFPSGQRPVTIAFISDIHVVGPDMPPSRLAKIVEQINALKPDYLFIAGDFISDKRASTHIYTSQEAIAPFAGLDESIIKVAVPGNHDHWFDMPGIASALKEQGFTLLANKAVQIGPLAIGGLDDDYTRRADLPATLAAAEPLTGGRIILTHGPDPFPDLPPNYGLMLAGHTHCGQIRYPISGPWGESPATMSKYGDRYACGQVAENGNIIITGAGLGTSVLPFRLFSKPEIWLVTIRPPNP